VENSALTNPFAKDVRDGLSASPKYLLSKYFYNDRGNLLFQQIMQLPEYYLTRAEFEIFATQSAHMVSGFAHPFHVVELGPGNGLKTRLFLKAARQQGKLLTYYPIDISAEALDELSANLRTDMDLSIEPLAADYFTGLEMLQQVTGPKLIIFMGSNIGNFNHHETERFFSSLSAAMHVGDSFLIGFDLKKDPELILAAYNDSQGITRAFNLNLLHRMNQELGANFEVDEFKHYPTYDPITGEARSYLVSKKKQTVHITALGQSFNFEQNEPVYMEVSRKYEVADIERYANAAGLSLVQVFNDCKHYFANALFQKNQSGLR
jgi:dimethylhistidine N-methyltransferase